MRALRSRIAFGLLLSVALPGGMALAADPGEQLMLERANYWRAQHRLDLAGQILSKLLATNPGQPDALYQQGLMASEQGDSVDARQYFDRLRQLAPVDHRAAELVATLQGAGVPPSPASAATQVSATQPATTPVQPMATAVAPTPPATVATTNPLAPAASVAAPASAKPVFSVASADSDDLIPANAPPSPKVAAPRMVASATTAARAQAQQVAALPQTTVSDSATALPTLASASFAGAEDAGISARAVQVAQVELEPPPPVGGYQSLPSLKPYSPTDTLETDIERDLTRIETQANPQLITGPGFRWRDGQQGTGSLNEVGLPTQLSFSPWYTGTATFAVLPVYLDAGSVGPITGFGTNPLVLGIPGATVTGAGSQNAGGVGLLGSYALGDFSGSFGTTPLGFPVTNYIGNIAYQPKFWGDTLIVRFEGSRQPIDDSLLSFAGTHADISVANTNPIRPGAFGTSNLWGGVVRTGGQVSAFYDDQTYGGYGSVGANWITGTNVADNASINALLGTYFRPWKTDNWALRVGVSLYYIGYDKNLGGFTFGQGGYFSPQDFEGLGFPVEWTGHDGPWSWLASTTLGVQHFNERPGPVFPNNFNAQVAVATLDPAFAHNFAVHSTGFGFNLKGQVEYAVDDTTTLGAAGSVNNGNDYNEAIVQLYLRKTFDWFAPVAAKNDPRSIAARDMPASRL